MAKTLLIILDGFGIGKKYPGNAYEKAEKPFFENLFHSYPWTLLKASGNAVGVPEGNQGGSEIGHFTIGAGRMVWQTLEEINSAIKNKSFFENPALKKAFEKAREKNTIHLIGMISDQGVHSDQRHLYALLQFAKQYSIKNVYIHAITDGRDVHEKSAKEYLQKILDQIKTIGAGEIATIVGRYYAMDRDNNWEKRTRVAYDLYTLGKGIQESDPITAIDNAYSRGIDTDYYIDPIILNNNAVIHDDEAVIFWNFRTDRTRQLTQLFTGEQEISFKPEKIVRPYFVCFGPYSKAAPVAFPAPVITHNLGSVLDAHGVTQLRIAETQKFAHVTYFFNSQITKPFKTETRIMIDSPKCASYAEKPAMSAPGITESLIPILEAGKYQFIALNFANCDLVGHSGDFFAAMKAVETVDLCLRRLIPVAIAHGYTTIITGDHGNVEYMIYEDTGEPCPSHTINPVPFILVSAEYKNLTNENHETPTSGLSDIAPTILKIMQLPQPQEMTGKSLI